MSYPFSIALAAKIAVSSAERWVRKRIHVALRGELLDAADVLNGVDPKRRYTFMEEDSYWFREAFRNSTPIGDALGRVAAYLLELEGRMAVRRALFRMLWEKPEDLISMLEDLQRRPGSNDGIFGGSLGHTEDIGDYHGYPELVGDPIADPNGGGIFSR